MSEASEWHREYVAETEKCREANERLAAVVNKCPVLVADGKTLAWLAHPYVGGSDIPDPIVEVKSQLSAGQAIAVARWILRVHGV